MPVDVHATTQYLNHAGTLIDVTVDDPPVVDGVPQRFRHIARRRQQATTLVTEEGYRVTCTNNQEMRGPGGWVAARHAVGRELIMQGYPVREGTWSAHHGVLCWNDRTCVDRMHALIRDEQVSNPHRIVLFTYDGMDAQRIMLAMGIRCMRTHNGVVWLDQPHAARYASLIGCVRPSVQEFALQSAAVASPRVPAAAQRAISVMLDQQRLDEGGYTRHAAELQELRELCASCSTLELDVADAIRMTELLRTIPAQDGFIRNALIMYLRDQGTERFVVKVKRLEPCNRIDLIDLPGGTYLADGFVCRGSNA